MVERNGNVLPNVLTFPKTIELEQRLAQSELTVAELREILMANDAHIIRLTETINMLHKRVASLQAQFDHIAGKLTPY